MSTDLGNYEAQAEVFRALRNDDELSNLAVGGFHNKVAIQDAPFPRVVYTELYNAPSGYADGKEVKATVNYQISIFTDSATVMYETQMIKAVDRIMKSLEYGKYDADSLYETDTKLHHKLGLYTKNFY